MNKRKKYQRQNCCLFFFLSCWMRLAVNDYSFTNTHVRTFVRCVETRHRNWRQSRTASSRYDGGARASFHQSICTPLLSLSLSQKSWKKKPSPPKKKSRNESYDGGAATNFGPKWRFWKKSVVVLDYTSKRFSAGPEDKWRWLFYIYFLSALASFSILFYFFFKYVVGGAPKIKYEAKEKKKWQGWWW